MSEQMNLVNRLDCRICHDKSNNHKSYYKFTKGEHTFFVGESCLNKLKSEDLNLNQISMMKDGNGIKDVGCGFVAFSMPTFLDMDFSQCKGYQLEAWIKAQAVAKGLKIIQLPIDEVRYYEKSPTKRGFKMFFSVWWFIVREGTRFRFWNKKNYLFWLNKLKKKVNKPDEM